MNKHVAFSCLLALALAFAQNQQDTLSASPADSQGLMFNPFATPTAAESVVQAPEPAPAPPEPVAAPAPQASKPPPAPEEKTVFDSLRGHAYNPYSNQGAASTVEDLVLLPSDISGQKFFYISPVDFLGYAAFELGGGSALLGLDNSAAGDKAALILGYATPAFGFALNYSVSKTWASAKNPKSSSSTTDPGDNIGLYLSIPLGSATLYANGSWLTYSESVSQDNDGNEFSRDYSAITANAGLTGSSGSLEYDAFLSVIRTGGSETNDDGDKYVDDSTYTGAGLGFNLGYAVLQSSKARVLIGLNNFLYMKFYDERGSQKSDNTVGFIMSPNLLGEVAVSESLLAFTGAAHSVDFLGGNNDKLKETTYFHIKHSNGTAAFAGLRYQKTNWALEAQVSSNPFEALNGQNIFYNLGGFIYF